MSEPIKGAKYLMSNAELAEAILVAYNHTSSTEVGFIWQKHFQDLLDEQKRRSTLMLVEEP